MSSPVPENVFGRTVVDESASIFCRILCFFLQKKKTEEKQKRALQENQDLLKGLYRLSRFSFAKSARIFLLILLLWNAKQRWNVRKHLLKIFHSICNLKRNPFTNKDDTEAKCNPLNSQCSSTIRTTYVDLSLSLSPLFLFLFFKARKQTFWLFLFFVFAEA